MRSLYDGPRLAVLSAALLIALFTTTTARSSDIEREKAILVLDASGSMWGQIDGVSKIEIAREQIAGMLGSWDEGIDLGLIAYGHRQKGACDDIEVVLEPGPVEVGAFSAAVNAITPVGKTPLSASVRIAAEAMRYEEESATVILLSDGLENCNADPCALAEELEAVGVDFTAHVIGFDLSDTDAAELSCLAETTGGAFFVAGNADALTESLRRTVETIAEAAPEPEPVPEPVVVAPDPEPEPAGPFGLRVSTKLCEDCELVTSGVFWRLYEAEADSTGNRREVARRGQPTAFFENQAPGEYVIEAAIGDTRASVPVTVEPDALTEIVVVAGAGTLRVRAEASAGGTPLNDTLFYRVYAAKTDLAGNRRETARNGAPQPLMILPAGDYVLRVEHGETMREVGTSVAAGALTDLVVPLDVAYLRVAAIPTEGAAPLTDMLFYRVYEAKKDLQGNRREVARNGSAEPLFRLPEGDYIVEAKHGEATATVDVSIEADTLTETVIDMDLGYLRATSVMAEGLPSLTSGLFYRVFEKQTDLQGNQREVARNGAHDPLFRLTAGDYVLVARYGTSETKLDVTIGAGTLQEVSVVLGTGLIRAVAVFEEGGDAITGGLFWRLLSGQKDLSGNRAEIARSGAQQPEIIAKAGSYLLRAQINGEDYDFPVVINPGEVKDLTVLLQR